MIRRGSSSSFEEEDSYETNSDEEIAEVSSQLNLSLDEVVDRVEIARGRFGRVYKATCRGQTVAVKILDHRPGHDVSSLTETLRGEVTILNQIRHPNICLLMAVCRSETEVGIMMDYIEGRSLEKVLEDRPPPSLARRMFVAREVASGMNWLHMLPRPILHRDLKPANILVTRDYSVKICDFGLSCLRLANPDSEPDSDSAVGTPIWMAPEVLNGRPNVEGSDVYAFGIILWQLLTLKQPFEEHTDYRKFMLQVIDHNLRPPIPEGTLPELRRLLRLCWHREPSERPSFELVLLALDDVLVKIAIHDEQGVEMWRALSLTNRFYADWEPFWEALSHKCAAAVTPEDQRRLMSCVKLMIVEKGSPVPRVSVESFGQFLSLFGPMTPGGNMLREFLKLCGKRWFHGNISKQQAEERLMQSTQSSAFLVRVSESDVGAFTISKIGKERVLTHQRFWKVASGYVINLDAQKTFEAASVVDLIGEMKKVIMLRHSCSGSDFSACWTNGPSGQYVHNSRVNGAP